MISRFDSVNELRVSFDFPRFSGRSAKLLEENSRSILRGQNHVKTTLSNTSSRPSAWPKGLISTVQKTAEALGIHRQMLYGWIREHQKQEKPFLGKGVVSRHEVLHKLRQELKRVTEERDFLKKTAACL